MSDDQENVGTEISDLADQSGAQPTIAAATPAEVAPAQIPQAEDTTPAADNPTIVPSDISTEIQPQPQASTPVVPVEQSYAAQPSIAEAPKTYSPLEIFASAMKDVETQKKVLKDKAGQEKLTGFDAIYQGINFMEGATNIKKAETQSIVDLVKSAAANLKNPESVEMTVDCLKTAKGYIKSNYWFFDSYRRMVETGIEDVQKQCLAELVESSKNYAHTVEGVAAAWTSLDSLDRYLSVYGFFERINYKTESRTMRYDCIKTLKQVQLDYWGQNNFAESDKVKEVIRGYMGKLGFVDQSILGLELMGMERKYRQDLADASRQQKPGNAQPVAPAAA